jgi:hypothetical protein
VTRIPASGSRSWQPDDDAGEIESIAPFPARVNALVLIASVTILWWLVVCVLSSF